MTYDTSESNIYNNVKFCAQIEVFLTEVQMKPCMANKNIYAGNKRMRCKKIVYQTSDIQINQLLIFWVWNSDIRLTFQVYSQKRLLLRQGIHG